MSLWEQHQMASRVSNVLESVHLNNEEGHHFGRPYLSAYQLAIRLLEDDPTLAEALDLTVGGSGTGRHVSLAQYVARQLSGQIKADPDHFVEGAFLSNELAQRIVYRGPDGEDVSSSLVGTNYDMSLFRLRS